MNFEELRVKDVRAILRYRSNGTKWSAKNRKAHFIGIQLNGSALHKFDHHEFVLSRNCVYFFNQKENYEVELYDPCESFSVHFTTYGEIETESFCIPVENPEEFPALLEVFNRYPITELTVHPRVRKDFYKEPVREDWFRYAYENSKNPLCYNGNLMTKAQSDTIASTYPRVESVMVGRALIADPGMFSGGTTHAALEGFLTELTEEYVEVFGSARNAMFRLKENWGFLHHRFEGCDKLWKQLRKTTDIHEFNSITAEILLTLPLTETLEAQW